MTEQYIEIVERKGIGHPDTICDSVAEAVSIALAAVYLERFGSILHHNIDKSLLVAGQAEIDFGGGRMLQPMELIIGDRATDRLGPTTIPVADIAEEAAVNWFKANLPHVDPQRHLHCRSALAPGSAALTDIFARGGAVLAANDTSAVVGYWPLSPTESLVLELETYLNSAAFKKCFPESGQDVKIMGVRTGQSLDLTVAMPLLAQFIDNEQSYFSRKEEIRQQILMFVENSGQYSGVTIHFNTLDTPGRGVHGIYLSLLGTSADSADSGQVGRGNRVNGVIPLKRPAGSEAAAGKNPVSHVGKIYNLLAFQAARAMQENIVGVTEAYVWLLSRIGEPVDQPALANIQLALQGDCSLEEVKGQAEQVLIEKLLQLNNFSRQLAAGSFPVS